MEAYIIRRDVAEDWLRIPEMNPGTFTWLEPPLNIDVATSAKGAEFAKSVFGAR